MPTTANSTEKMVRNTSTENKFKSKKTDRGRWKEKAELPKLSRSLKKQQ